MDLVKYLSSMKLITYLPISRVEDIREYQIENIRLLRPSEFVVFIDNVNYMREVEDAIHKTIEGLVGVIDVRVNFVNVGNRSETLLMALEDARRGDVIVDSDVVLHRDFPSLLKTAEEMSGDNTQLIGVADADGKPGPRDVMTKVRVDGGDYPITATRIVLNRRGHSPVFFGPKQAIIVNHNPIASYIDALMDVLGDVPKQIRQCIADETILGLYALMIGQRLTPWFPMAFNAGGSGDACDRHIRAYAHYLLFKKLRISGLPRFIKTHYFVSAITHW
jgi:hypothetical protein